MDAKQRHELLEAARNAATGYATVILGIVCFILALMVVAAAVRFTVGLSAANTTAVQATQAVQAAVPPSVHGRP